MLAVTMNVPTTMAGAAITVWIRTTATIAPAEKVTDKPSFLLSVQVKPLFITFGFIFHFAFQHLLQLLA